MSLKVSQNHTWVNTPSLLQHHKTLISSSLNSCTPALVRAELPQLDHRSSADSEKQRHLQAVKLKVRGPNTRTTRRKHKRVRLHKLCLVTGWCKILTKLWSRCTQTRLMLNIIEGVWHINYAFGQGIQWGKPWQGMTTLGTATMFCTDFFFSKSQVVPNAEVLASAVPFVWL